MASSNPTQLFLLADHIKLSLLERSRAIAMNLPASAQDNQIARSLDSLDAGISSLEAADADPLIPAVDREQVTRLRQQCGTLQHEFQQGTAKVGKMNDEALVADARAASRVPGKAVRFRDNEAEVEDPVAAANRASLFPYRDDPDDQDVPDQSHLDNQQIHQYHQNVISEQDEHLDRLGRSIGRTRDLSIAIGDELDGQVELLGEVDEGVDRHQSQLDGATRRLNTVAKRARENWGVVTIVTLVLILVCLIIITK
jgi:syntaxin 8